MSKARAIILSVEIEGLTQSEAADRYAVSKSWVSKLMARYRNEGDTAFEPRSRRPHTSPTRRSDALNSMIVNLRVQLVEQGLDAGPVTIQWHLAREGHTMSVSTIRRRLVTAGLIVPEPRKRPRSSYIRFQADLPNGCWQSDFTHCRLINGNDHEVITWLDDHSRYALNVTVHKRITGPIVAHTFTETAGQHGHPASVLTDNGLVYTTRFAGYPGGRNRLETLLAGHSIEQKHTRPNHPTTTGKVERFQQTMKKWLTAHPSTTAAELQHNINAFVDEYNHRRPHRSLGRATPAVTYNLLPKDTPTDNGAGIHHRVRHDKIDTNGAVSLRRGGRMHHISIGRAFKHTPVVLLIDDLDIRVVDKETGELLRALILDPDIGFQPRLKKR